MSKKVRIEGLKKTVQSMSDSELMQYCTIANNTITKSNNKDITNQVRKVFNDELTKRFKDVGMSVITIK